VEKTFESLVIPMIMTGGKGQRTRVLWGVFVMSMAYAIGET
jgi:hypothetical protein